MSISLPRSVPVLPALLLVIVAAGCSESSESAGDAAPTASEVSAPAPGAPAAETEHTDHADHDHAEHVEHPATESGPGETPDPGAAESSDTVVPGGEFVIEVLEENFGDGAPSVRRGVKRNDDGVVSHGSYRRWNRQGTVIEQGEYVDGLPHGPYRVWHTNGHKKSEGVYDMGLRTGRWSYYDTDGKLIPGQSGEFRANRKIGP